MLSVTFTFHLTATLLWESNSERGLVVATFIAAMKSCYTVQQARGAYDQNQKYRWRIDTHQQSGISGKYPKNRHSKYKRWLEETGFVEVQTAGIGSHSPMIIGHKSALL